MRFISENFGKRTVSLYQALNSGAGRADFFRILKLYKTGGVWFDADLPAISLLDKEPLIIDHMNQYQTILFRNRRGGIRYTLIGSQKESNFMLDLNLRIHANVHLAKTVDCNATTIGLTGPHAMGNAMNDYCTLVKTGTMKTNESYNYRGDKMILLEDPTNPGNSYNEENTIQGYRECLEEMGLKYHSLVKGVSSEQED